MYTFQVTPLFEANYNATEDIVINQGGTDSGKTYALLQVLATLATTTVPPSHDAPVITVLSESVPNARKGAWRIMQSILQTPGLMSYVNHIHQGERTIYFKSGWLMEFVGATDEQNAKQGKRQYLFVNEANGVSWPIFWQMAKRTRIRTFIDYNPTAPFWAHENLIGTVSSGNDLAASVKLIISDHRHNTFLTEREHEKTENILNPELWRVYARGLTGNLQGLIYTNWQQVPDEQYPWNEDGQFGGLDFGYTNDPTAGVQLVKVANKIFAHELCYKEGMPARQIKQLYTARGFHNEQPIYCDHDETMIRELRQLDLMAVPARKGANSIKSGIHKVQEYQIFYTASSINIDFERRRYMWMKDKSTGKATNTPTEIHNHLMDAIRYGVATHYYREAS